MRFEWDEEKAAANQALHSVTFEQSREAFSDPSSVESYDEEYSTGEDRYRLIGITSTGLLTVVYTVRESEQGESIRIISAWRATTREERIYEGEE